MHSVCPIYTTYTFIYVFCLVVLCVFFFVVFCLFFTAMVSHSYTEKEKKQQPDVNNNMETGKTVCQLCSSLVCYR